MHGPITVAVVIAGGRMRSGTITACGTTFPYPHVSALPAEVVAPQGPHVNRGLRGDLQRPDLPIRRRAGPDQDQRRPIDAPPGLRWLRRGWWRWRVRWLGGRRPLARPGRRWARDRRGPRVPAAPARSAPPGGGGAGCGGGQRQYPPSDPVTTMSRRSPRITTSRKKHGAVAIRGPPGPGGGRWRFWTTLGAVRPADFGLGSRRPSPAARAGRAAVRPRATRPPEDPRLGCGSTPNPGQGQRPGPGDGSRRVRHSPPGVNPARPVGPSPWPEP